MRNPALYTRSGRLRYAMGILTSVILASLSFAPLPATAENSVEIESKWVEAGESNVKLGIYLTNSIPLSGVLMTYEIRMIHVGSFIRRSLDIRPQGRLMEWAGNEPPYTVELYFPYRTFRADHPTSCKADSAGRVWQWMETDSLPDFMGEEALLYCFFGMDPEEPTLLPGTDGTQGNGIPSAVIVFDVTEVGGAFIIDSTCTAPSNHLTFIDDDPQVHAISPTFRPGIVLIGCNAECHGDPNCDGACNLIDLVRSIDVAFNNAPAVIDPDPRCPVENTDVNCDLVTDVLDIARMINVQYRMSPMSREFCAPCDHIPRTGRPKDDVRTPYFRNNGS